MSIADENCDDIIVSGIAGRSREAQNVNELKRALDQKSNKWKHAVERISKGKFESLDHERFDQEFFSLNLGEIAKFQIGILLEHTYEAILDAGLSPRSLVESNTGVFVAGDVTAASEISRAFGIVGPSLDFNCSFAQAIDVASQYMKSGGCNAAVVAECKSDEEFSAIFLQKRKSSKRIYAHLVSSSYTTSTSNDSNTHLFKLLLDFESESETSSPLSAPNVTLHLARNPKEKPKFAASPEADPERMLLWSGRTESAIDAIFDDITSRPLNLEHIALLQATQTLTSDANGFRGFAFFKNEDAQAACIDYNIRHFDGVHRPIVFVFGGMGTQWHGMGRDLMQISLFADSIEKSHAILLKRGVNLSGILHSKNKSVCESFLTSSLAIVSIEIALVDVMRALGVQPDFIIGHSVGEVACAYADSCLTREEALTTALMRAKLTLDSRISGGALAAVGVHYTELPELPPEIDVACINGRHSTTISGPKEFMIEYVVELKVRRIPVNDVPSAGIAFHSRYVERVAEKLKRALMDVVTRPKLRSLRWITSSFPEDCDESELCDANYLACNFTNPVYFENAAKRLPQNALLIELSPHGILQAVLKSAVNNGIYVNLTHRAQKNGKIFFMESLGKIFQAGIDLDIGKIYPAVEFPVSHGTPMISPLIKWNHRESQHKELST